MSEKPTTSASGVWPQKRNVIIDADELNNLRDDIEFLKNVLDFHARAAKLMKKKKAFIAIAIDEPYFIKAYDLIRDHEIKKGSWDTGDELNYLRLIEEAKIINMVLCPDCEGSGEVAGDYFADDGMTTCERCKGKGLLPA